MSATAARTAALAALRSVRHGVLADAALTASGRHLDARDRAWLQELVYGTLRLRGRLDHRLAARVHAGLDTLEPEILDILRLGVYQLTEMGGVPAYAAVSQAVDLARGASGPGAARLVNGVLRSIAASGEVAFPPLADDPVAHLTTWGSHPRWLVERWLTRWGVERTAGIVEANNTRPVTLLRPFGMEVEAAVARLAEAGIAASTHPGRPPSVRLSPGTDPAAALALVPGIVQDPAAGMVVEYADFPPDAVVADLCAAPGGKALGIALRASQGRGFVAAGDRSPRRQRRLRENVERLAGLPIAAFVGDARQPTIRAVDGVLVDVPCTGTGTLRRHADARWRVRPADLESLAALQRDILEGAAEVVGPGGTLVYATCSLEPEENEQQVEAFLRTHTEFERAPGPAGTDRTAEGDLFVLPEAETRDGAFAARLRRTAHAG